MPKISEAEAMPVLAGPVKWYDAVKGYGFVVPDDGSPEVMVHASCVNAFGRVDLPEGSRVRLVCAVGSRGLRAHEILEIVVPEKEAAKESERPVRPTDFLEAEAPAGRLEAARVKWFDKQKGFGFVNIFGSSEDIFVHMETVRRCGFIGLTNGESVAVRTARGPNGQMVAEVRLWEASFLAADRG